MSTTTESPQAVLPGNKKFDLLLDDNIEVAGITLFRIRARIAFGSVSKGELGGYVEKTGNVDEDGNARVFGNADIFWASRVGSENGTLTVFRATGGIEVTRGCFFGTVSEFLARVAEVHGDSRIGREYRLLIDVALSRLGAGEGMEAVA